MAINKTSAIDLNVPAKVISVNVTAQTTDALWEYDDGLGDLWWSGGSQPKAYRWELTMTSNSSCSWFSLNKNTQSI